MATREIPASNCGCFFASGTRWGTTGWHFRFMEEGDIPQYDRRSGITGPKLPFEHYADQWIAIERCPAYAAKVKQRRLL